MTAPGLTSNELALMRGVFERHCGVTSATLFGSRAKGTHTSRSDVDVVVSGEVDALEAEAISAELDELPMPYRFDVQAMASIAGGPVREHVERVGIVVYRGS